MANRPIAIFYSWQSDLPNNKTRGFIQSCIEAAVKSLRDAVVVDAQRDTDGVPGTPDIVQTIFSRIDECDLFIADVSTVGMYTPENHPDRIKLMPNPNVMLELGYAAKSLDWSNVICLKNTDFDSQGELPFDLAHRRLTGFSLECNKVADERKRIRDIIASTVMDYEREICKYIASPINDELDAYEFTIESLRPNETKWIGPLIALRPNVSQISLTYSIRSVHSDGKITGSLHYAIQ